MPVACRNSVKCPPSSNAPARNREPPSNVLALRTCALTATSPNRLNANGSAPAEVPNTAPSSSRATRHRIVYGSASSSNRCSTLIATLAAGSGTAVSAWAAPCQSSGVQASNARASRRFGAAEAVNLPSMRPL